MRDYGELHNFVCPMTGKYHYVVENDHIPIGGPSTLRYVAAHRVGEMPADSIPYFKLLVTTMSLPPGADCQVWSHSAMDTLERSLLGWVDTKKRLILDENLPSRKDPNGVYLSTRRNMCDLDLLDSEDYVHSTKPVTSMSTVHLMAASPDPSARNGRNRLERSQAA